MQLSEVRINLCESATTRLKAFCSLTFDNTFVIRDVKLIEGNGGLFVAMPSRKLCDRCRRCGEKNHLRARFCNNCGQRLADVHHMHLPSLNGQHRIKLHADIAHPINPGARAEIERQVLCAYRDELERSKLPGYLPSPVDHDLIDFEDEDHAAPVLRLRPTGTT